MKLKNGKLLGAVLGATMLPGAALADLPACGNSEGGNQALQTDAMELSDFGDFSSLQELRDAASSGSTQFWNTVASNLQSKYGCNISTQGLLSIQPRVKVGFASALVGNFPMPFSGTSSINYAVRAEFYPDGTPPPANDPSPCDPDKNCCAECSGNAFAPLRMRDQDDMEFGSFGTSGGAGWSGVRAMAA